MLLVEPRARRWTRREYYEMADRGWFAGQRVELIAGEIVEMPAQRDQHASGVTLVDYALRAVFGKGLVIRIQSPMDLGEASQPEPDVLVVRGSPRGIKAHPTTAVLIVEVSDTTLAYDRGRKASLYASKGIADYWILNLVDGQLEIRRRPVADKKQPLGYGYAELTILQPADTASPLASRKAKIRVGDLLP